MEAAAGGVGVGGGGVRVGGGIGAGVPPVCEAGIVPEPPQPLRHNANTHTVERRGDIGLPPLILRTSMAHAKRGRHNVQQAAGTASAL